ncbi:MAG TPA: aminotransferase class I/II-fold pyridoxal phosphate-dependent enzyme [Flavitalea sp.]|nr:aminotransferase class I/II-fold pyridoxal phosphate-dependent enzyme [Flavitalea sp.]
MGTNRRLWVKQIGFGLAGLGLTNFQSIASPVTERFIDEVERSNTPIILSSNENPYGPSPLARKALADNLAMSNRYNWDLSSRLIADLAKKNNVTDDNILLGSGSTEILDLVSKVAAVENGSYVIADPSYNYWTVTLDNMALKKIKVPLTVEKKLDLPAMRAAIGNDTKLVYICNPNNPTGTICERDALLQFITAVPKHVTILVDEAYIDFTPQQSLANLINSLPNMIIAKTFSKIYGLAGARIGYAIANKTTIDKLSSLQSSPNGGVSVLSRLAAIASLKDDQFVSFCRSSNEDARKYTISELGKLNCECIPSNTSFIYFSLANFKRDYFQLLKDNNIRGTKIYEEQGKWTRITVGTMQEMQQFISALQ